MPTRTSELSLASSPPSGMLTASFFHSRYEAFDKLMEAEDSHWIHEVRALAPHSYLNGSLPLASRLSLPSPPFLSITHASASTSHCTHLLSDPLSIPASFLRTTALGCQRLGRAEQSRARSPPRAVLASHFRLLRSQNRRPVS